MVQQFFKGLLLVTTVCCGVNTSGAAAENLHLLTPVLKRSASNESEIPVDLLYRNLQSTDENSRFLALSFLLNGDRIGGSERAFIAAITRDDRSEIVRNRASAYPSRVDGPAPGEFFTASLWRELRRENDAAKKMGVAIELKRHSIRLPFYRDELLDSLKAARQVEDEAVRCASMQTLFYLLPEALSRDAGLPVGDEEIFLNRLRAVVNLASDMERECGEGAISKKLFPGVGIHPSELKLKAEKSVQELLARCQEH